MAAAASLFFPKQQIIFPQSQEYRRTNITWRKNTFSNLKTLCKMQGQTDEGEVWNICPKKESKVIISSVLLLVTFGDLIW